MFVDQRIGTVNGHRVAVSIHASDAAESQHMIEGTVFEHEHKDMVDLQLLLAPTEEEREKPSPKIHEGASHRIPGDADCLQAPSDDRARPFEEPGVKLAYIFGDPADPFRDPIPGATKEACDAVPGRVPMALLPGCTLVVSFIGPFRTFIPPCRAFIVELRRPVLAGADGLGHPVRAGRHGNPFRLRSV
jgi:hypothetical protein